MQAPECQALPHQSTGAVESIGRGSVALWHLDPTLHPNWRPVLRHLRPATELNRSTLDARHPDEPRSASSCYFYYCLFVPVAEPLFSYIPHAIVSYIRTWTPHHSAPPASKAPTPRESSCAPSRGNKQYIHTPTSVGQASHQPLPTYIVVPVQLPFLTSHFPSHHPNPDLEGPAPLQQPTFIPTSHPRPSSAFALPCSLQEEFRKTPQTGTYLLTRCPP